MILRSSFQFKQNVNRSVDLTKDILCEIDKNQADQIMIHII